MSQCLFIVIFGVIVLLACQPNRQDAVGKYVNTYESNAEHYVVLMPNDSFHHVYNGPLGHFVNTGIWNVNSSSTYIYFDKWMSFGKYAEPNCKNGCLSSVEFDGDELYFSSDLSEMNFHKE